MIKMKFLNLVIFGFQSLYFMIWDIFKKKTGHTNLYYRKKSKDFEKIMKENKIYYKLYMSF